jgi:hypothetical protein
MTNSNYINHETEQNQAWVDVWCSAIKSKNISLWRNLKKVSPGMKEMDGRSLWMHFESLVKMGEESGENLAETYEWMRGVAGEPFDAAEQSVSLKKRIVRFLNNPDTWEAESPLATEWAQCFLRRACVFDWLKEHSEKTGRHPLVKWVQLEDAGKIERYGAKSNLMDESGRIPLLSDPVVPRIKRHIWQFSNDENTLLALKKVGVNLDEPMSKDLLSSSAFDGFRSGLGEVELPTLSGVVDWQIRRLSSEAQGLWDLTGKVVGMEKIASQVESTLTALGKMDDENRMRIAVASRNPSRYQLREDIWSKLYALKTSFSNVRHPIVEYIVSTCERPRVEREAEWFSTWESRFVRWKDESQGKGLDPRIQVLAALANRVLNVRADEAKALLDMEGWMKSLYTQEQNSVWVWEEAKKLREWMLCLNTNSKNMGRHFQGGNGFRDFGEFLARHMCNLKGEVWLHQASTGVSPLSLLCEKEMANHGGWAVWLNTLFDDTKLAEKMTPGQAKTTWKKMHDPDLQWWKSGNAPQQQSVLLSLNSQSGAEKAAEALIRKMGRGHATTVEDMMDVLTARPSLLRGRQQEFEGWLLMANTNLSIETAQSVQRKKAAL